MVKERLNEVLHENNGLAEQVTDKENEVKCLQSEIERLEKRIKAQAIDIDVRYKPRNLRGYPFHLNNTPLRSKLSKLTS